MTVKIKWSVRAFEELRRASEVEAALSRSADAIAAGCNGSVQDDGYESSQTRGRTRSRASVITASAEAMADNAAHNTLISNLDRGRI